MTPVERLQAAIARLEQIEALVDPAPLTRWRDQEGIPGWDGFIVIGDSAEEGDDCNPVARVYTEDLADMLVTLHRTVDAQLAILRLELENVTAIGGWPPNPFNERVAVLALADAILGSTS